MFVSRHGLGAAIALSAGVCVAVSAARADQVTDWNDALLQGFKSTQGWAPPQLARAGAIVHSSIYDAVNSVDQRALPSKVFIRTPGADKRAAVIEAGYQSMSALFGAGVGNATFQAQLDSRRSAGLAAIPSSAAKTAGINLGSTVALQTLGLRAGDGSSASDAYTPGTAAGDWRPDYAGGTPGRGVGVQYKNVTPWAMTSQSQFRPAPCPPTTDPQYTAAYNQVKDLGARNSASRTADQTQIAWFWGNDRDGTFKPPGHYNVMVREIASTQTATMGSEGSDDRLFNNARLLALANVAMADAGIAAWDAKYTPGRQHFWRPITGIRNGDADNNPDTAGDANWEPLSYGGVGGGQFTPSFPAYVSGHATFGAAAGSVAREFFGTDLINFTLSTDDADYFALTGSTSSRRAFTSISQALDENDMSRIYLGVHWSFDSSVGRVMGTDIGSYTFRNALLVPAPGMSAGLMVLGVLGARRRRR